ncbi:putative phage tail protein [Clostridium lundense]|uniref:putative phage tail protein n=1 Tax=Clostridium lundense TaxID=319475 RepID=UPI0004896391|nr:putative phage tail protein [Clostridium lundense]
MSSYNNLTTYIPSFILQDKTFDYNLKIIGSELDKLNVDTSDLERQLFPETCTWGIDFWEKFCGINNRDKPLELRRELIITKFSSTNMITKNKLREIIKSYTKDNGSDIIYYFNKYMFAIRCNIDSYTKGLSKLIEEIKPAHLVYFFIFTVMLLKNKEKFEGEVVNRLFLNFRGNVPLLLDGGWLLNGQYSLDGYKNYPKDPITVKANNIFNIITSEYFKSILGFFIKENLNTTELFKSSFLVNKFSSNSFNNTVVKSKINFKIKQNESFTKNTLTIEKNLWFLNGKYNLDGTKILNSEIKREEL